MINKRRWLKDVRLISAAYSKEDSGVVIEPTSHGKSIVGPYHGFIPYFHLLEPPLVILEKISDDDEIVSL